MNPLNPGLFRALQRSFKHIEIVTPRHRASVSYSPDWRRGGRLRVEVTGGEYYKLNCPYCNDTRQRLNISYLWATRDKRTGNELLHVAHCFNEDCIDSRERRLELREMVFSRSRLLGPSPDVADIDDAKTDVMPPIQAQLPGGILPIKSHEVPDHVRRYVEERGFLVHEMWTRWRVYYSATSVEPPPVFKDRLVIPVYTIGSGLAADGGTQRPRLVGWQARAVGQVAAKTPKYLRVSQNSEGVTDPSNLAVSFSFSVVVSH